LSYAIDANLLVYASDKGSDLHRQALDIVHDIAEGPDLVYVFWPVSMGYLRIATHPAIFEQPLSFSEAISNLRSLLRRPHVRSPGEGRDFWPRFEDVGATVRPAGNLVPDAHVVALMKEHGVETILTRDRDYRKFDGIRVVDPFA
jgi:uncharacterized protein